MLRQRASVLEQERETVVGWAQSVIAGCRFVHESKTFSSVMLCSGEMRRCRESAARCAQHPSAVPQAPEAARPLRASPATERIWLDARLNAKIKMPFLQDDERVPKLRSSVQSPFPLSAADGRSPWDAPEVLCGLSKHNEASDGGRPPPTPPETPPGLRCAAANPRPTPDNPRAPTHSACSLRLRPPPI